MRKEKKSEEEVAAKVVEWLQGEGWDVYQEVKCHSLTKRADIVATKEPIVWIVEVKTSLSLAVIEQAVEWCGFAHFISVAAPVVARQRFARRVCNKYGVGVIDVYDNSVSQTIPPSFDRKALVNYIKDSLCDEQKEWGRAGNANHEYYSPWRSTCRAAVDFVRLHEGTTMKELMGSIQHHYGSDATAIAAFRQWILKGKVVGIEARYDKNRIKLYTSTVPPI